MDRYNYRYTDREMERYINVLIDINRLVDG